MCPWNCGRWKDKSTNISLTITFTLNQHEKYGERVSYTHNTGIHNAVNSANIVRESRIQLSIGKTDQKCWFRKIKQMFTTGNTYIHWIAWGRILLYKTLSGHPRFNPRRILHDAEYLISSAAPLRVIQRLLLLPVRRLISFQKSSARSQQDEHDAVIRSSAALYATAARISVNNNNTTCPKEHIHSKFKIDAA